VRWGGWGRDTNQTPQMRHNVTHRAQKTPFTHPLPPSTIHPMASLQRHVQHPKRHVHCSHPPPLTPPPPPSTHQRRAMTAFNHGAQDTRKPLVTSSHLPPLPPAHLPPPPRSALEVWRRELRE
jgi:hypothetical protein